MIFNPDFQDILKSFSALVTDDPQGTLSKIRQLLENEEIQDDQDIFALIKSREALCYKTLYDTLEETHYIDDAISSFKEALDATDDELLVADISYELGMAYAEKSYLLDSESVKLKAISRLEKAALHYSIDGYPEDYGSIHWNIGVLYHDLAEKNCSRQSFLNAIDHYLKAKSVFTKDEYPSRFAEMSNSLGLLYTDFAHSDSDSLEYLASALSSFLDAIDIYEQTYDMDHLGKTLVNAALTCMDIFNDVGDEEYVLQAIELLKRARSILFDERGNDYLKTLYNLALALMRLSHLYKDSSHDLEAIEILKELMTLSGSKKDMHLFAAASYEAGRAYQHMYSLNPDVTHLEEAISMFTISLDHSKDASASQEMAATYLYLGDAKTELGIAIKEPSHIVESLGYFDGAIKCYGAEYSAAMGTATLHKAMAEQSLYELTSDQIHLSNSIVLYESALEIFGDAVPDARAEIGSLLAEVYMLMHDIVGEANYLKKAYDSYSKALAYFSKENAPERHMFIKNRMEEIKKDMDTN